MKIELSVIAPVHNESGNIIEYIDQVVAAILKFDKNMNYELILVDDGSTDESWSEMTLHLNQYSSLSNFRFKLIKFASNYGQSSALLAGMRASIGNYVLTMDSDLQHPPALIQDFFNLRSKAPVVWGVQEKRHDKFFKKILSDFFYTFAEKVSGIQVAANAGDFRLIRRDILDQLLRINGDNLIFRFAIAKLKIPYHKIFFLPEERFSGKSHYNFKSMFKLAINSISTLTTKPLQVSIIFSTIFFILSILQLIYILVLYFSGLSIPGWASLGLIISSGFMATFLILTVQSLYLSKVFRYVQNYPGYVVTEQQESFYN